MTSNKTTHPSHPEHHPLEVVDSKRGYTCAGCKNKGVGKRHKCEICSDFNLHPCCMFASPTIKIQGQTCHFLERPRRGLNCKKVDCTKCRSCDACGMTIMGFVYHCFNKDWDFHPTCVNLEAEIKIEDVTFKLEKQGTSSCAWCKRKLLKGAVKKVPGWSYVSKENHDYNFHVYCMMEMAMQSSSTDDEVSGKNMSSALQGNDKLPLKMTKSKKISKTNKWLRILKIFIGTVFSILLGDPTTIIASTMAHLVTEGLFHNTG